MMALSPGPYARQIAPGAKQEPQNINISSQGLKLDLFWDLACRMLPQVLFK